MIKRISIATLTASFLTLALSAQSPNSGDLQAYIGGFDVARESLRQSSQVIGNQTTGESGFSLAQGYSSLTTDSASDRAFEGDSQVSSTSIGYTHDFEGLKAGLSYSYLDSELDLDGTDGNQGRLDSEADGWLLSLFVSKTWENISFVAQGTFGELAFESIRQNAPALALSRPARTSEYEMALFQFELDVLYALVSNEDYSVTPFAKFGYRQMESDSFDEFANGSNFDRAGFGDFEDKAPYLELGVDVTYKGWGALVPFAALSIWRDLGEDEIELTISPIAGLPSQRYYVPDVVQTIIHVQAGMDYQISENVSIGAILGYFSGDEMDGVNAALSASVSF